MKVDYVLARFNNLSLKTRQGVKLRGYYANSYKDEELMHNHKGDDFIFSYPKVQYKVIDNLPIICGIQEGASLVAKVGFEAENIDIDGDTMDIFQKYLSKECVEFGVENDYVEYEFATPWIALNQRNISEYNRSNKIEREEILKKVLIGNILSMSKGLGYTVDNRLYVWLDLHSRQVNFKNIKMTAFVGRFKLNFLIPDYLGIGKAVSRGFGTVKRLNK
jgi:hypothetical protein